VKPKAAAAGWKMAYLPEITEAFAIWKITEDCCEDEIPDTFLARFF
jgi:hypothetical protein